MGCFESKTSIICWQFVVAVLISLAMMAICIVGLLGLFHGDDMTFYQSVLTLIIGVWIKTPDMKGAINKQTGMDELEQSSDMRRSGSSSNRATSSYRKNIVTSVNI